MKTLTKEMQTAITPALALDILKDGNKRFVSNLKVNRNLLQQANDTSDGQHPFAVILSCIDSRTSAELIFDQGLGDVFSIRIAGNVINDEIIGSAEFGCKLAGAKIILVLGHTSCGAVKGAVDHAELGHLHCITSKIQRCIPSTRNELAANPNLNFMASITKANVLLGLQDLRTKSPIISKMEQSKEIQIIGGIYDLGSGIVTFLE
jgi:carbonic anhydrase